MKYSFLMKIKRPYGTQVVEYGEFFRYGCTREITEFYKMTNKEIKQLGGTAEGLYYSVPFGHEGRGVKHVYYDEKGNIKGEPMWGMKQEGGTSDFKYHGLYSGTGSLTYDGKEESTMYNFNEQPIDYADAIPKQHDIDYTIVATENYAGFLEDVRTLQADKDMLKRINEYFNPFKSVEGIEESVRKSFSLAAFGTLIGQKIVIGAIASYKEWIIKHGLGNESKYEDNRNAFKEAHTIKAFILDKVQKRKK